MFTINGKKITLSSNDTLDSLKGKISSALGTLPALIEIPNNIVDGGNYIIKDPIFFIGQNDLIQIKKENNEPITWEEVKKVNFDQEFLLKLYIITKIQLTIEEFGSGNEQQGLQFALFELQNELGEEFDEKIWNQRTSIVKDFKNMVIKNLESIKKQNIITNAWDLVKPNFKSTNFIMNKINHQTEIPNISKLNELMVFDAIKLNDPVIACFYREMIKFNPEHKHLIDAYLNQDWVLSSKIKATDIIRIMITYNVSNARIKYKMVNVYVEQDKIIFNIETLIHEVVLQFNQEVTLNLRNLIKNILNNMDLKEAYKQHKNREFYYGSYSSPINVSLVVLKDLLTNDPNVYNISFINESALINTRKTNLNIFLRGSQTTGNTNIGVSLFERPDSVGTFIRIKKIVGESNLNQRIDFYMGKINKILQYTYDNTANIVKFYRQYINLKVDTNPFIEQDRKDEESTLKAQVPEIFLTNYTRLCNKPPVLLPTTTDITDVDNLSKSNTVLKFPIYGETTPRLYTCPYPDYKYPGLRENNKLDNKDKFPFVPCCYQRPQHMSKNFRVYYNQEVQAQRTNAGEIGKSLKILAPERLGVLPPKIDKLLNYTTGNKFFRYGVPQSKSSCLTLLNKITNNHESEQTIRLELSKRAELCKGEFNTTVSEIVKKIKDSSVYINPRLFKGALEDYYQISYILFSKDKDDFSVYPNKFIKFICPLKKKVILMIEHEDIEHVELVVDEETSNYVNRHGKRPIFTFEKNDSQIKKIFSLYKERFNFTIYDVENKQFNVLAENTFQTYPWEYTSANGKVVKYIEPLNQYVDSYGQTRLVEFINNNIKFVGEFEPLPCLKLPIKELNYFKKCNDRLTPQQIHDLENKFKFLKIYQTNLDMSKNYTSSYLNFKKSKKIAEYILWAACHVYSTANLKTGISLDDWIEKHTMVVNNYTYSNVTLGPIFNISELMVKNKFIFSSLEFKKRIRYNLSLLNDNNLKLYTTNIYHSYYNDRTNFKVEYPTQLALTKQEYFQRTREPYILNVLTLKNLKYLKLNTLYFIQDLFDYFKNILCLFLPSLEKLVDAGWYFNEQKITLNETKMYVSVFDQENIRNYVLGHKEPSVHIIMININTEWFYGLILPKL